MKWVLQLYPPRWRQRYGAELAELIASQPVSIGGTLDLLAGAIDAWIHPELIAPATSDSKGESSMIAKTLRLKCAGYGPDVTSSDKAKSTAVNLGGTLTLALLWLWARSEFAGSPYLEALSPMAFLLPYLVSLRYTSLKGRSPTAQAIFVVGFGTVLTLILLLAAWVSTSI